MPEVNEKTLEERVEQWLKIRQHLLDAELRGETLQMGRAATLLREQQAEIRKLNGYLADAEKREEALEDALYARREYMRRGMKQGMTGGNAQWTNDDARQSVAGGDEL